MPTYRFHSADGARETDPTGIELPGEDEARLMAVQFAGEVLEQDPARLWRRGQWRVEVTDDANALLFTVITLAIDAPRPDKPGC